MPFLLFLFALLGGLLPGSTSAVTCPVEVNHAYKSPESSSVYFVSQYCTKRAFRNARIYFSYFASWGEVRTTSATKLKSIPNNRLGFLPWGPKRQLENGSLIKTTDDGKVYLYVNGQLRPISDPSVFEKQGFKWEWIEDVDTEVIKKHQKGTAVQDDNELPTSAVFKYSDAPEVYVIEDQDGQKVKRHIKDLEELKRLYRLDRILEVSRTKTFPEKTGSDSSSSGYDTAPKQSASLPKDVQRVGDIKNDQANLERYKVDEGYYPIANGQFNGFLMSMLCSGGFSSKCDKSEKSYMNTLPSDPDGKTYTYKGFDGQTYTLIFEIDSPVGNLSPGTIEATPTGMKNVFVKPSAPAAPAPVPLPYPTTGTSGSQAAEYTGAWIACVNGMEVEDGNIELCKGQDFLHKPSNVKIQVLGVAQGSVSVHITKYKQDGKISEFNWTLYKGQTKELNFFENIGTTFQLKYLGQLDVSATSGVKPLLKIESVSTKTDNNSTSGSEATSDSGSTSGSTSGTTGSTSGSPSVWNTIPASKCTGSDVSKPFGEDMTVEICFDKAFQQYGGNMRLEFVGFNSADQKVQLKIRGVDQYDWSGEYIDMNPGDQIEITTAASFGDSFTAKITYQGGGDYDNPAVFFIHSEKL